MAKMRVESKASKNKVRTGHKLSKIRENLNILAQRANQMVSELRLSGVDSAAVQEAYMSLRKVDRERWERAEEEKFDAGVLFDVTNKKRYSELQREAARIDKFLSSASAHVKIASYENKAIEAAQKHGLSFHNQADVKTGLDNVRFRGYDQDKIKLALEIYRRVEETGATVIYGNNGKGGFGSDPTFNLIFDEIEGYDPSMSEDMRNRYIEKAIASTNAALDEFRHSDQYGFLMGAPKSRRRDQNIISELAKSKTAEQFFKRNKWLEKW